jgi:hypothetical protein
VEVDSAYNTCDRWELLNNFSKKKEDNSGDLDIDERILNGS